LVAENGKQWRLIAKSVPNRSNIQVRARYPAIDPSLSKDSWTLEEDANLTKLVEDHGASWTVIAGKLMNGNGRRSNAQCARRWRLIDPALSKEKWSDAEEESLTALVQQHGSSAWSLISSHFGGRRNDLQCRARWQSIDKSLRTDRFTVEEDEILIG
jgi:hypothetical protein